MQPVDRAGIFKAKITGYGLTESEKGAVGIVLKAELTDLWDPTNKEWYPWAQYEQEAEGAIWIVKKDGTINQLGADSLIKCAGWDGNLESITGETWQPTPVQVAIDSDEYNGKTRFRINFVNPFDRTPGMMSTVSADKARELQNRFGGLLRAIAGNARRNGATPNGAPPPPARPASPAPPPPPVGAGARPGDDYPGEEIPF